MKYQEIPVLTRSEIVGLLQADNPKDMAIALLSSALFDEDGAWSEAQCLQHLCHPSLDVKFAALTSLSHLARLQRKLNLQVVLPILAEMQKDPSLTGRVTDTLDDIRTFVSEMPSR